MKNAIKNTILWWAFASLVSASQLNANTIDINQDTQTGLLNQDILELREYCSRLVSNVTGKENDLENYYQQSLPKRKTELDRRFEDFLYHWGRFREKTNWAFRNISAWQECGQEYVVIEDSFYTNSTIYKKFELRKSKTGNYSYNEIYSFPWGVNSKYISVLNDSELGEILDFFEYMIFRNKTK